MFGREGEMDPPGGEKGAGQGPRAPKDRDPREGRADQRNHGADDGDDGGRGDGNGERDGVTGGQPGAGPNLLGDHRTVLKKRNRFVGTFVPNRMWLAASGRASMFSRVPRLLPAASSAQVAWSRTTTPLTSHHPPAAPSRMWLCAGSGMSPKPASGT